MPQPVSKGQLKAKDHNVQSNCTHYTFDIYIYDYTNIVTRFVWRQRGQVVRAQDLQFIRPRPFKSLLDASCFFFSR